MSDNYKPTPSTVFFGPDSGEHKYSNFNQNTKKFDDLIENLIRNGIIESYANVKLEEEQDNSIYNYGAGGPAELSQL